MTGRPWLVAAGAFAVVLWLAATNALLELTANAFDLHHWRWLLVTAAVLITILVVIGYPVYYTIDLSFFKTPASLQLRDKIFVGLENYGTILKRIFAGLSLKEAADALGLTRRQADRHWAYARAWLFDRLRAN